MNIFWSFRSQAVSAWLRGAWLDWLGSCQDDGTACFEGSVTGVNATETGNEVSQHALEFTSLFRIQRDCLKHLGTGAPRKC